jgi:uncharacterized protein YgiM (DUF1202 family)
MFFFGMFFLFVFLLISVSAAIFEQGQYEKDRPAIVFADIAGVKSEPKKASANVIQIHEGTKVYVKETLKNWKKVQLTDGTEGWIESDAIKEVK